MNELTLTQALRQARRITLFHVNLTLDINKRQARAVIKSRGGSRAWESPYSGGDSDSWSLDGKHLFLHMAEV